ncbi:hypothetical protein O3G_MSEX011007 [Manduca sexta]|uniref:Cytochrome P450 n=1 Tax=Manduca sexta TaxID=7130 RepID=A0A921ZIK4_MANSE|nr:hypothetical protein O3G_MSEX011007 [Manduca sexta]KAG6458684.1 hypothetical protein O3G_MSEX011007 [Manduca sexta]
MYLMIILSFTIFLCVIHLICNYNGKARELKKIPGPPDRFIIGNLPEVLVSAVDLMKLARKYAETFNGIYRFWVFPFSFVNIYNPQDIEILLSGMKYHGKSEVYKFLKPWLGEGLLISRGDKWMKRRKILTPAFHFNVLRKFCGTVQENSQRLVETLEKAAGETINVVHVISEFTLNSICETAMGTQLNAETTDAGKAYKDAIYELGHSLYKRFITIYMYYDFIFAKTIEGRSFYKHLKALHSFTQRVIVDRKKYVEQHGNTFNENQVDKTTMLDMLIAAEKDGRIDSKGIQEEVDTFMFEGHDTTAAGLSFCLMLLANHSDIQDKIVAELKEIFGDSTRPANMEDFSKMRYLECCIKESLRLYPPVHFISRDIHESVKLSNYTVPAGTICHIFIYDLHRRSDLYENPSVFNPDRFLPENSVGRHPYAYIPFSAGPRNCIGQKFAMMEMKSSISEILRKFELQPVTTPSDIEITADLILRNAKPIEVRFVKRLN